MYAHSYTLRKMRLGVWDPMQAESPENTADVGSKQATSDP